MASAYQSCAGGIAPTKKPGNARPLRHTRDGALPRSACLLRRDPAIHPTLDQVQRHRAATEDGVVEAADVELLAELGFGFLAQLLDLDHADLVGGGLAG